MMAEKEDTGLRFDRLERRLTLVESLVTNLKDEASGLTRTVGSLIKAEHARTEALEGQHYSYLAAAQRAEAAEARSTKLEADLHRLEDKLADVLRRFPDGVLVK